MFTLILLFFLAATCVSAFILYTACASASDEVAPEQEVAFLTLRSMHKFSADKFANKKSCKQQSARSLEESAVSPASGL